MQAGSVAGHSRHRVQRLQNCVVHRLSFSFEATTDHYVLMNGDYNEVFNLCSADPLEILTSSLGIREQAEKNLKNDMLQRKMRNFSYCSVVLLRKEFRPYLGNILMVGLNETKTKAIASTVVNHVQQLARYFHILC